MARSCKLLACLVYWNFCTVIASSDHCKHHRLKNYWILRTAAIWQSVLIPCDFSTDVAVDWTYCHARSYEIKYITTNHQLIADKKDRFQLQPKGLLINDVQPSDAGWYICRENNYRRRKQIIRLSVPWEARHVHLGASIVLKCQSVYHDSVLWRYSEFHSDKSYILYWNRIFTKDPHRFEVLRPNSSRGIFHLNISNVQFSDAGMYRCGENSVQYQAEVLYKLKVTENANDRSTDPVSRGLESTSPTTTQPRQQLIAEYHQKLNRGSDRNCHTNMFMFLAFQTVIFIYVRTFDCST